MCLETPHSMLKRTLFVLVLSIANACFMLWLTFYLLSITQALPDEYELVRWSSIVKNLVFKLEKKPDSTRFLYVNVCWDRILIDKYADLGDTDKKVPFGNFWLKDSTDTKKVEKKELEPKKDTTTAGGEGLPIDSLGLASKDTSANKAGEPDLSGLKLPMGSIAITDRAKLVAFLRLLHKQPNHKLVLFDIEFKDSTPDDSVLTHLLNTLPRTLVSYHLDDKDKAEPLDLKIKPLGLSNFEKSYGQALKFKIFYDDTLRSTPLRMYEMIHKKKFKKGSWFYYLGDKPVLNSFILDYRVRMHEYQNRGIKQYLGEWMNTAYNASYIPCSPTEYDLEKADSTYLSEFVHKLTKDKIIIVGDFEVSDIHETIYGSIAGPLILLNAFLALEAGDNVITMAFLTLLFLAYFFISFVTFQYNQIYPKWLERLIFRRDDHQESFLETFTIFLFYFATLSITSYFFFNIHVGVLVLAFYMNILEKVRKWRIIKWLAYRIFGGRKIMKS